MPSRRTRLLAIFTALLLALGTAAHWQWQRIRPYGIDHDELGTVRVYRSWWRLRGVIFVLSPASGWSSADEDVAERFARRGYHVLGIDTGQWLARENAHSGCVYLPSLLENFSRDQQRRLGPGDYRLPSLVGQREGATLIYMTHLQAPPLSFEAAVALNPVPQLPLRTGFCNHPAESQEPKGQIVRVEKRNPAVPLRIWSTTSATTAERDFARAADGPDAKFTTPDGALFDQYHVALESLKSEAASSGLKDLPLVEVLPERATQPAFAIIYSGDGGWRDLDKTLAGVLAEKGMPVVGYDTLSYFWREKPPEAAAQDLARVIRFYRERWHRSEVVLIGFSFGANVMPFLYNRLPSDVRSSVKLVSLLSPERGTAFSVNPTEWVHIKTDRAKLRPIEPELAKVPRAIVQCVYGEEEVDDSVCVLPAGVATKVLRKPGGHHFDEDYDRLANDVLAAVPR